MTEPGPPSAPSPAPPPPALTPNHVLQLHPEHLVFTHIRVGQTYSQCIRVTNPSDVTIACTIKPGNGTRYTVRYHGVCCMLCVVCYVLS